MRLGLQVASSSGSGSGPSCTGRAFAEAASPGRHACGGGAGRAAASCSSRRRVVAWPVVRTPVRCASGGDGSSGRGGGPDPRWQRELRASRSKEERQQDKDRAQQQQQQRDNDILIIGSSALGLTALATLYFTVLREPLADWALDAPLLILGDENSPLGLGDLFGAITWSAALYFTSPLQLLFLFFGRVDVERPSDWLLRQIGSAAGLQVDSPSWETSIPGWAQALTVGTCVASGLAIAVVFNQALGDATWSVSTGLGSCMAAGMFEAARPRRLNEEEALELQGQWQDFARFADRRLQRLGRCHESEVAAAFKRDNVQYRGEGALAGDVLRDMIRNWHPGAERTPKGFYKNLSVLQSLDPFTLETSGTPRMAPAPAPPRAQEQAEAEGVVQQGEVVQGQSRGSGELAAAKV